MNFFGNFLTGFTDAEVKEMLKYYEIEDYYEDIKNWYDGYRFGSTEVPLPSFLLRFSTHHRIHLTYLRLFLHSL
mgnify:CR=1 FL=1